MSARRPGCDDDVGLSKATNGTGNCGRLSVSARRNPLRRPSAVAACCRLRRSYGGENCWRTSFGLQGSRCRRHMPCTPHTKVSAANNSAPFTTVSPCCPRDRGLPPLHCFIDSLRRLRIVCYRKSYSPRLSSAYNQDVRGQKTYQSVRFL